MSPGLRCEAILRLIDEVLDEAPALTADERTAPPDDDSRPAGGRPVGVR